MFRFKSLTSIKITKLRPINEYSESGEWRVCQYLWLVQNNTWSMSNSTLKPTSEVVNILENTLV